MRIILIGGGEVGFALARPLSAKHEIFVVDHNPEIAERFASLDVEFVAGSATNADALRRAGVDRADLLVACTGLDEVNMMACAIANRLGTPRTICLVSRDDFIRPAEGGAESIREHFGIERVLWPEAQLAEDIERIIAAPGAIDAEVFAGGRIRLLEYRLTADAPLIRGPIASLHVPPGALIVAAVRGDTIEIPRGDTRLAAGDKVFVMGTAQALQVLQPQLGATAGSRRQIVTIVGGGDVGLRLAERLEDAGSAELRVIERDRRRGEMLAARLRRALVLHGDGTDLELLEAEEIGRSDVLVSVIDNDERNLFASLLGRQLGVRRIITRVGRPANLRLFHRVGIDVALSARGAAVASILHDIEGGRASLLAVLEEGQAKILDIEVPADYRPRALRELAAPPQSIVGAILRGEEAIVPRGSDEIRPHDHLLVFASAASEAQIRQFFATGT